MEHSGQRRLENLLQKQLAAPNFKDPAIAEVTKVARADGNRTCVAYAPHSCTESTNSGFCRDAFTSLTAYACQILQTFKLPFSHNFLRLSYPVKLTSLICGQASQALNLSITCSE